MAATERLPVLYARAHASLFQQWLAANPRVWELFVAYTQQVIGAGYTHYSADAICHRIRWHEQIETRDVSGFRVNNNHVAYLARRYEEVYPQHAGFFRMRDKRTVRMRDRRTA